MRKSFKVNFHANAGWWPEPRYQGWTSKEWQEWISEPAGSTWCENKRYEADWIADWMIRHWGKSCLQKGVLDVGGEPGFLAAALLSRGISVTVVDPTWGITGKDHWSNDCVAPAYETGAKLTVFNKEFNQRFLVEHPEIWQIAVVASLYGDEATIPALSFAVDAQKPSAIVPCNECAHFFPEYDKSYEGYCQALLQDAWWRGGHFDVVFMEGVPFSRSLLVQGPKGFQAPVPRPSGFMKASEWERQTLAEEQARRSKGQTRPPCQF
eukprot:symbB.v1.2.018704.t1/scaffold1502.1/size115091/1